MSTVGVFLVPGPFLGWERVGMNGPRSLLGGGLGMSWGRHTHGYAPVLTLGSGHHKRLASGWYASYWYAFLFIAVITFMALLPPLSEMGIFYRPQTKFAKLMFSQVSVCPRGRGRLVSVWGGLHPEWGVSVVI